MEPRKRGRPKATEPKAPLYIKISQWALDHLRSSGAGWQPRVSAAIETLIREGKL